MKLLENCMSSIVAFFKNEICMTSIFGQPGQWQANWLNNLEFKIFFLIGVILNMYCL